MPAAQRWAGTNRKNHRSMHGVAKGNNTNTVQRMTTWWRLGNGTHNLVVTNPALVDALLMPNQ